jgi:L-tartrate/succinate antiporter
MDESPAIPESTALRVDLPAPPIGGPASVPGHPTRRSTSWWRWLLPISFGLGLAVVPTPPGLVPEAWRYFSLFAALIAALVLEPIPAPAVGLVGVSIAAASGLVSSDPDASLRWALSGFANSTVWLIFAAFMFASGYERTGLGRRIALVLVRRLGGSALGMGYAIVLADVSLAPFTPSNTARSAGTVFPVIRNIPPLFGSEPGPTARRIGAYLMWVAFATTTVTSSMFLTALAPNLLAVDIVAKITSYRISMGTWALGFAPVGILLIGLLPWLVYVLYPPEVKGGSEVPRWADGELRALGSLSRREVAMALLAVVALGLWAFGKTLVDPTTAALLVLSLMVLLGVVSWQDVVGNKPAWNTLVLFGTLVTLADGLNRLGFAGWFASGASALLTDLPPAAIMAGLVAIFYLIHYMFATITAHATAVLPVVLAAGITVPGVPAVPFALLLCYSLGVMGILTPYATGPAPVYFGSGFISRRDFWTLGLIFGLMFLAALLAIGIPWLRILCP